MDSEGCLYPSSQDNLSTDLGCVLCISSSANSLHVHSTKHVWCVTAQLDADVVQFFCVGGIPPSKASLPEWKQIFQHAAPTYQPASASKLKDYHIPSEVALVRTQQLEHLQTCTNLCITFDGQKIRLPQSVYTIHIITPEQRICCFDGHEASEDSHTGEHLFKMLDEVSPTDLLHDSQLCQS